MKKPKSAALDTEQIEQGIQKNIFAAPPDNRVLEVNTQRLRSSASHQPLSDNVDRKRKIVELPSIGSPLQNDVVYYLF